MTIIKCVWSRTHNRHAYYDSKGDRLPEISILDLAEIPPELDGFNQEEIILIWNWIKNNIKQLLKLEKKKFFLIQRKGITTEIRLAAEDFHSLLTLKERVFRQAIQRLKLTKKKTALNILVCEKINPKAKQLLLTLQKKYVKCSPKAEHQDKFLLYSCTSAIAGAVWERIEQLGDSYIFVAHSVVPYLLGFYKETRNKNCLLTEFHLDGDPYKKYRKNKLTNNLLIGLNHKNNFSSPLIIDRSYTGGTLLKLKKRFPQAKIVALFPKTRKAIESCDYFVINNQLFYKREVDFSQQNWYINLVKKSLTQK